MKVLHDDEEKPWLSLVVDTLIMPIYNRKVPRERKLICEDRGNNRLVTAFFVENRGDSTYFPVYLNSLLLVALSHVYFFGVDNILFGLK